MMRTKQLLFYPFFAMLSMFLFACSSDSSDESSNTTDVAVTGNVTESGMSYAKVEGYVNLDKLNAGTTPDEMGIEYGVNGNMGKHASTRQLEGRKITVKLSSLLPGSNYSYRTYVKVGKFYQYGQTKTFSTSEGFNVATTGDISDLTFFSVTINANADWSKINQEENAKAGIAYSKEKNLFTQLSNSQKQSLFAEQTWYSNTDGGYSIHNPNALGFSLDFSGLAPNTHYYYCAFTQMGDACYLGEIKEFTTKSVSDYVQLGNATNVTMCTAEVSYQFNLSDINLPQGQKVECFLYYATSSDDLKNAGKRNSITLSTPATNKSENAKLTALLPNSTYYYQLCARLSDNIECYGEEKTFTTNDLQSTGAVDMGTGCKWAICDLGVNSPELTGSLFAFGETAPRDVSTFVPENYAYNMSYTNNYTGPIIGNNSSTEFDASTKILGQPWRTPSREEVKELDSKCQTVKGEYKDVQGFYVLSDNGNALFFPSNIYWTATLECYRFIDFEAQGFYLSDGVKIGEYPYYYGFPIRPVQ